MSYANYQEYLASREWALKKEAVRQRSQGVCERCHRNRAGAVHHLTYERLYNERPEDLRHTCDQCHAYLSAKSDTDPAAIRVYMAGPVYRIVTQGEALRRERAWLAQRQKDASWQEWTEAHGDYNVYEALDIDPNTYAADEFHREELSYWRNVAFPTRGLDNGDNRHEGGTRVNDKATQRQFIYGGPNIDYHCGGNNENHSLINFTSKADLVRRCLGQVQRSDAIFCWLDRTDSTGSIVELGYARACTIPIFVYCASREIAEACYFAVHLAENADDTVTATVQDAWRDFATRRAEMVARRRGIRREVALESNLSS